MTKKKLRTITSICNATVINIGTLNEKTVRAMIKAGKKANELSHVVVLDPVGAGASALRTETTFELLDNIKFSVIRGNISEIKTLARGRGTTKGVDADVRDAVTEDNLEEAISFAKKMSKNWCSNSITGAIDLVADSNEHVIRNGHLMSKITARGAC